MDGKWFNIQTLIALLIGVFFAGMIRGFLDRAKSKVAG